MAMNVDGELLAKRELDDGLILSASEKRDPAAYDRNNEGEQRPEHHPILLAAGVEWEPESRAMVDLSSTDAEDWHARKREENQCERIMGTDSAPSAAGEGGGRENRCVSF
jgi:hypothetical protein